MLLLHKIKRWVLKLHIQRLPFPEFHDMELIRQRVTYIGKVQRVGFRDEMKLIAKRLSITGNVENADGNRVIAELQGTPDRIDALKQAILNEKRFIIEHVEQEVLDCIPDESEFSIIR